MDWKLDWKSDPGSGSSLALLYLIGVRTQEVNHLFSQPQTCADLYRSSFGRIHATANSLWIQFIYDFSYHPGLRLTCMSYNISHFVFVVSE